MLAPDFKTRVHREFFEHYLIRCEILDIMEIKDYIGNYSIGIKYGTVEPIILKKDDIYISLTIDMVKINRKWMVNALYTKRLTPFVMQSPSNDELVYNHEIIQEKDEHTRTTIH